VFAILITRTEPNESIRANWALSKIVQKIKNSSASVTGNEKDLTQVVLNQHARMIR